MWPFQANSETNLKKKKKNYNNDDLKKKKKMKRCKRGAERLEQDRASDPAVFNRRPHVAILLVCLCVHVYVKEKTKQKKKEHEKFSVRVFV